MELTVSQHIVLKRFGAETTLTLLRQQHRCVQQVSGLHCEIQANAVYVLFAG